MGRWWGPRCLGRVLSFLLLLTASSRQSRALAKGSLQFDLGLKKILIKCWNEAPGEKGEPCDGMGGGFWVAKRRLGVRRALCG